MNFEQPFIEAMQAAVTPTEADVLVARTAILAALADGDGSVRLTEFENRWLTAVGGQRPSDRSKFTAQPATQPGRRLADPDPRDPHVLAFRGRHAVLLAVAQLTAEGVLTRAEGNQYEVRPERIPVDYAGGSASVPIILHTPLIGERGNTPRFMPVRPLDRNGSEVLLPVDELLAGLDDILGVRGVTMVRESRRALQRGLYLASSSLLCVIDCW